jgi:hypothetical protein
MVRIAIARRTATLVVSLALSMAVAAVAPVAVGAAGATGRVAGRVTSWASGVPVAGATVALPGYGLTAVSRRDGSFAFPTALPTGAPYRRIEAVVTAAGYGRWTITGAPLFPGDTLLLTVQMRATAFRHHVLTPKERAALPQPKVPTVPADSTCTGWDYVKVPPPSIWVFVTADKKAEQFDFSFYVAHVLPKEWAPSWDADALGAGAIAAKTYAAYRAMSGHARTGGTGCYDILDTTADQVFDPNYSLAATDQAVYATFGSIALRFGTLFLSNYFSGSPGDPCAAVTGQYAGWMSQWGTQTCGTESVLWPDIVTTFYDNIGWTDLQNLLLNPGVESNAGTYPWGVTKGTLTRIQGGANSGKYYLRMTPNAGKPANASQQVSFDGTSSTQYHAEVALRCDPSNAHGCTITLNVVTVPGSLVSTKLTISEPNDGVWRDVGFDPAPAGVTHSAVRFSVIAKQIIGIDAAKLNGPFGGP